MNFVKLSENRPQNIRCSTCNLPLVVENVLVHEMHVVVDVVETTTNGDKERTYCPLLPPFYFCSEHVRNNNTYFLKENL